MTRGDSLLQLCVTLAVAAAAILAGVGASEVASHQRGLPWFLAAEWVFGSAVLAVVLVHVVWPLFPRLARLRAWIQG